MSLLGRVGQSLLQEGLQATGKKILARLRGGQPIPGGPAFALDMARNYPHPLPLVPPAGLPKPQSLVLHWVLPDFHQGGGGHMTLMRLITWLEAQGHDCHLWINGATAHADAAAAKTFLDRHYLPSRAPLGILRPETLSHIQGDAVIATDCWTAYPVSQVQQVRQRFYLVQDFEPSFYPQGSLSLLAENTYKMGFYAITAGKWLQTLMAGYGMQAQSFDLAYDPAVYRPRPCTKRPCSLAFYARQGTPRRAVELGLLALEQLHQALPQLEVSCFGNKDPLPPQPFRVRELGILDHAGLARLYQEVELGITFSTTNYSLIPQEMMACGLAVLELDLPSTRAAFAPGSVALAAPWPQEIAQQALALLKNPVARQEQALAGLAAVQDLSWPASGQAVERALRIGLGLA